MLDSLLAILGIHRVGMLATVASQVIRTFEQEFQQDHSAKAAAIDTLIDVLQKHKSAVPVEPVAPVVPVIPAA